MSNELKIDGSQGEGGGQILRTSIALATLNGRSLHIRNIRSGRARPGLKRQHLTAIRAAAEICDGKLVGDELNSGELRYQPGDVQAGNYHFSVGSAGSACLVFQTVLWPLLFAKGNSEVIFEGGTHNPMAPPYDYIERCFLPVLAQMGAKVSLRLERHGFMPAGGGRFVAEIEGNCKLRPIEILDMGPILSRRATAIVAQLPGTIAIRELREVRSQLEWKNEECLPKVVQDSRGPGNALLLEVVRDGITEMAVVFGERRLPAEEVAIKATKALQRYLDVDAPVGEHLADQLIIPFSLSGGGAFRAECLSLHSETNIDVVRMFSDTKIDVTPADAGGVTLRFS